MPTRPSRKSALLQTSAQAGSMAATVTARRPSPPGSPVRGSMRWWTGLPSTVCQWRWAIDEVHTAPPADRQDGHRGAFEPAGSSMAMAQAGWSMGRFADDDVATGLEQEADPRTEAGRRGIGRPPEGQPLADATEVMGSIQRHRPSPRLPAEGVPGGWTSGGFEGRGVLERRGMVERRTMVAETFEVGQHAGIEAPVRQPSGPIGRGHGRVEPTAELSTASAAGQTVERRQLAVVAVSRECLVDGRELVDDRDPGGRRRRCRRAVDLEAQRRGQCVALEADDRPVGRRCRRDGARPDHGDAGHGRSQDAPVVAWLAGAERAAARVTRGIGTPCGSAETDPVTLVTTTDRSASLASWATSASAASV